MAKSRDDYLRVTHVLYPFSGLDKIDSEIIQKAAERGTKVHKCCESIMLGLGDFGVDDHIVGYVDSFKKWWQTGPKIIEIEKRFWDDENELTGQVDMIAETEDGLCIVDIKTSSKPSPTWEAQGSAYAYLARKHGYNIKKVVFLHLSKHGKEPTPYEYAVDESFFLSILRVFLHFFQGK